MNNKENNFFFMNRRGIELALSTLIMLVLGVLVLIGLVYMLTDGFARFRENTKLFLQTSEIIAVREACNFACGSGPGLGSSSMITYCCQNFTVGSEKILCTDERLELDCIIDCVGFSCS